MSQLGTRISLKNYPKVVQQKSRRVLLQCSREFGKDITNNKIHIERNDISTETSCPKIPRKTILRVRSVSANQKGKCQLPKQSTTEYEKSILHSLIEKDKTSIRSKSLNLFEFKLRALTLDWIIDIHFRLQLKDQTLYLFFQYFDEYCRANEVEKSNLRKIALTCLWIASKFEERNALRSSMFANITNGLITKSQIKETQHSILQTFGFNLIRTTPLSLAYIVLGVRRGTHQESLCRYIFQLSYAYNLNSKYQSRCIFIVSLILIQHILKQKTEYRKYRQQFKIDNTEMVECFKDICVIIQKSGTQPNITALKKKFQKAKNHEVGNLKFQMKQFPQNR